MKHKQSRTMQEKREWGENTALDSEPTKLVYFFVKKPQRRGGKGFVYL